MSDPYQEIASQYTKHLERSHRDTKATWAYGVLHGWTIEQTQHYIRTG